MRLIIYSGIQLVVFSAITFSADVYVTVDAGAGRRPISPMIYGKNNSLSDDPKNPLTSSTWRLYREAGLRILRENGGNNCTKYNWRLKLTSHPDWYNNVYDHDWDFLAKSLQDSLPAAQGMLGLQLLGKVAANKDHNFNDWDYNQSAWWSGCGQNLAGGGVVNPNGGDSALTEGNSDLYLTDWPADSATAIFDHWFGTAGLGLDKSRFRYWNMDNEPEIWSGTHDDVVRSDMPVEEFLQKYFAVAKSARGRFPGVKLVGFVACNEWQWYAWNNATVAVASGADTQHIPWARYFIKRIAEEQKASGIRLIDVMDFHFYAGTSSDPDLTMQLHRIWFDSSWVYPKANGCKLITGGWDENIKKEYIMRRCRQWLDAYMGPDNGVGMGVSECGNIASNDPNVVAVWYASQLGTFADEGVELFTPWDWYKGQWETLHLFSRYSQTTRVATISSLDSVVAAYASIDTVKDSMTIVLVNRDRKSSRNAAVSLSGFSPNIDSCGFLRLSGLPADSETFVSHDKNALKKGALPITNKTISISLPSLSVTAIILTGKTSAVINRQSAAGLKKITILIRSGKLIIDGAAFLGKTTVALYTIRGECIRNWSVEKSGPAVFHVNDLPSGRYALSIDNARYRTAFAIVR